MNYSDTEVWFIIAGLAIGTYLIRFSFLGAFGRISLPDWAMRLLRYTPVAVLPGLVAPLVLWPAANGGAMDAPRLLAALITLSAGLAFKNVLVAMMCGASSLIVFTYLLG